MKTRITVIAEASLTTQYINPPIRHTLLVDGSVVFDQTATINVEAGHIGIGLTVELDLSPGTHTVEYYNNDEHPWEAYIINGGWWTGSYFTNPSIVAYGLVNTRKTLKGNIKVGTANIHISDIPRGQQQNPGTPISGTISITNDGITSGTYRLKVAFLGTSREYLFPWATIGPGQTVTYNLAQTGLTVPHWTEINHDLIDMHLKNKLQPWTLLQITVEELLTTTITTSIGILSINYYDITDCICSGFPFTEKFQVPQTVRMICYLTWGNLITYESEYIANAPTELYINEKYETTLTTDSRGCAWIEKTITVAGKYLFYWAYRGSQKYPPATATGGPCRWEALPTVGPFAKIIEMTLPCGQTLDPGTYVTGKITVQNQGDAEGYLMVKITHLETLNVLYSYTTTPVPVGQTVTFKMTEAQGVIVGLKPLDLLVEAGITTDVSKPLESFISTDQKLCSINSSGAIAKGHLVAYNLPTSLEAGKPITGTITVQNIGTVRGKIAVKLTTLWNNKVYMNYLELDPNIMWNWSIDALGLVMPNQNATIRIEVGHLTDTTIESFVLDEPPTEHTITLAAPPPPGYATIYGYVKDAFTGKPVAGATVTLDTASTTTASDGWYSINVPAGTYTFKVSKPDYETHTQTITLATGEARSQNVSLKPTKAVVKGRVRDAKTGVSLADVTVQLDTVYSAKTLSDGTYMIEKIEPARTYTITASKTGYQTHTGTINIPTADVYTYDITLTPAPPPPVQYANIEGVVKGLLGPVGNVTVCINGNCTATNPDGSYTITNIPLGTYILTATPPPLSLYAATSQTIELTEPKTYTVNIYLPLNIIKIGAMAGGMAAFTALAALAVKE